MALQELRKAMQFTQEQIADQLKMDQGNLSRLEKRADLMLTTLRRYIEAMGGSLKLVAEFPRCPLMLPPDLSSYESSCRAFLPILARKIRPNPNRNQCLCAA